MEKLTVDNYKKGFLIDDEWMAGISESTEQPGNFIAYVVRHSTGETLGAHEYTNVFEAIRALNDIPRAWSYDAISKCGSGNCGNGNCGKGGGGCGKRKTASSDESAANSTASSPESLTSDATPCAQGACSI